MCIVVVKKLGVKFPSVETIQQCCESNPDGFSMAWNEGGELKNFKTMSHKSMMKHYRKFIKEHDENDTAFVFHARIATHGSLKLNNCHCWISDGMAFAHNGILSIKNRGDMTDSETFFRDIFIPCYRYGGSDAALNAVNACIGTSKFAFIDGNGLIATFGDYNKDKDGNMYSNYSYVKRVPYFGNYTSWGQSAYASKGQSGKVTCSIPSSKKEKPDFTKMTLDELDDWWDRYLRGEDLDF